jgi:hypothetical protein
VRVSHSEGATNHTDPAPWRVGREPCGQALAGARAGWVLSRERSTSGCRRFSFARKATPVTPLARGATGPREVEDPMHARTLLARNLGDPEAGLATRRGPRGESERSTAAMYGIGKSDEPIVPAKRPNKGVGGNHVRRRARREGVFGRGKSTHALQNLDSAPKWNCNRGRRGYATPLDASLPKAGARCGSAARRDLCGGRPVRAVPTATGMDGGWTGI